MSAKIRRRTFIGTVGAAAGTAVLTDPFGAREADAASSNVYSGHHANLVTGSTTVQDNWVQAAMDACVKAMTGKTTVAAAWEDIFPNVTTSSTIAIKINCLKKEVSPHLATIKALVNGITQMFGGFPAKNISLFDNNLAFAGITGNRMALVYGSSNLSTLGVTFADPSPQYSGGTFTVKGKTYQPGHYLAQADYGISLAALKPHQYYGGGITGVIKNMMGACSESTSTYSGGPTFHDSAPFQPFVDLFKNYMKANLQLYVVDMLFAAQAENASGWSKVVRRITIGKDPCAVDAYFADVLTAQGYSVTKGVPQALANAGLGNASYNLVEPTVSLGGPVVPTRDVLDGKVRDHRDGKASDGDVKALIKQYRGQ